MQDRNPFEPPLSKVASTEPSIDIAAPPMHRPATIDLAFWLIIGSAVLGVLSFLARGMREPGLIVLIVLLVLVGFAFLIRSGQNWARIVYLVFFALGLFSFLLVRQLIAQNGALFFVVFCAQTVLQGCAAWLVLRAPGARWFKRSRDGEA